MNGKITNMDYEDLLAYEAYSQKKSQEIMNDLTNRLGGESKLSRVIDDAYSELVNGTHDIDADVMLIVLALKSAIIEDDCSEWAKNAAEHISYGNSPLISSLLDTLK